MTTAESDRISALEFLYSRINYERLAHVPYDLDAFKLDRMRLLLARLGDPHLALKAAHIAGTKGKGSTAAMIATVLEVAGYKTALYTSPHLERLEERFAINGKCVSEAEFASLAAELMPVVERMDREGQEGGIAGGLTFFEITTALGFLHFARQKVDIAVLEVGLGGRLDSTNVCQPEVSVITSISYDHMKQLGNTLTEIAREKAGIIKPGVPVVSGVVTEEPRQVIVDIAQERNAPLIQRGRDFDYAIVGHTAKTSIEQFDYWRLRESGSEKIDGMQISLLGSHQCANAAVAIASVQELVQRNWSISEDAIRRGLATARCRARVEILGRNPTVIMDVAHNTASIRALVDVLGQQFPNLKPTLIFASSRDKDVVGMLRVLLPACETLILTRYVTNPRAMETAELDSLAQEVASQLPTFAVPRILVAPTPAIAWENACRLQSRLICITGSFFLAADMAEVLRQANLELKAEI